MQNLLIKASGLFTFPHHFSAIPQGALLEASNVVINRDSIIECRRGMKIYGNSTSGGASDTVHQLLTYKTRMLRHHNISLEYDSDGAGTFLGFSVVLTGTTTSTSANVTGFTATSQLASGMSVTGTGVPNNTTILSITNNNALVLSQAATATGTVSLTFNVVVSEVTSGLRIKSFEANSNLYFTTANGIKKISVASAADLSSAVISKAGGIRALDLSATLTSGSFFNQESIIGYRLVWGKEDANNNEILGAPSSRCVISNPLTPTLVSDFNALLVKLDALGTSVTTGIHAANYVSSFKTAANAASSVLRSNIISLASAIDNDVPSFVINAATSTGPTVVTTTTTSSFSAVNLITVASATGIVIGQVVTGTGFDVGTTVSGVSGLNVTLNQNCTTVNNGETVTFTTQSSVTSYTVTATVTTNPTNIVSVGDNITVASVVASPVSPNNFNTAASTFYPVTAISATTISYSTGTSVPGTYASGGVLKRCKYTSISQPSALNSTPTTTQLLAVQTYYNSIVTALSNEPSLVITDTSPFASSAATTTKSVTLVSTIPQGVTTGHFYQLYRTAQTTAVAATSLSNRGDGSPYDPGDEQELVYEANPTNTDLNNGYITIADITPDSFRGANLYTNPNTGEGIAQSNTPPPLAADITTFKGYAFYANTQTLYNFSINLLAVGAMVSGTSTLTVTDGTISNTYTFVNGVAQIQTITTVADSAGSLNSKWFNLYSAKNATRYYVWYNINGAGVDPAISGATGIRVSAATNTTANNIALATRAALNQLTDFTITGATNQVIVTNNAAGIATAASNGTASAGFSYSVGTTGTGEDATNKKILISSLPTPAQQVDETSQSLIRVINKNQSEQIYGYYLSGPTDIPGKIYFESKNLGGNAFYLQVNSTATGNEFSPALPTSGSTIIATNNIAANQIYYSKYQQPEAVPIVNTLSIGPKDKSILRILALRDNLFVLKQDAIYRISGLVAPFTVSLFDSSAILKAPDSAVVLNNIIYCYTSQGVSTVSDAQVSVISRPIEDQLVPLTTPSYSNFSTATFGVSYESDRTYYLWTVSETTDSHATQVFKFNTFTNSWVSADQEKRCGIVSPYDDKLYLGPTDVNYVEQERKNFDRTDYADRQDDVTLSAGTINANVITLPTATGITEGDVFVQTQYLTISQINAFLQKLDNDTFLTTKTYYADYGVSIGDSLNDALDNIITAIANDSGRLAITGHTSAGTYTALSPVSSVFATMQTTFNSLMSLLNNDPGIGRKNYINSSGSVIMETLIESVNIVDNTITTQYTYPIIQGVASIYQHIACSVVWVPQTMEDVSMTKQVSEGTLLFEDSSYSTATISYSSDLSNAYEDIDFTGNGNGNFGNNVFGSGLFGGAGGGVPFRTYIPREKQRCRYINIKFSHAVARESFAIYGVSLTYNPVSQRGYR